MIGKKTTRIALAWLMILAFLAWAGCEDESPAVNQVKSSKSAASATAAAKQAEQAKKADQAKKAEEERKITEDYVYISVGKRDPFMSIYEVSNVKTDSTSGGENKPTILSPLQRFDVQQFRITGIIWGTAAPMSNVVDPEGRSHVVKPGSLIGRNWGKVTKIKKDSIIVSEVIGGPEGRKINHEIELRMAVGGLETGTEDVYGLEELEEEEGGAGGKAGGRATAAPDDDLKTVLEQSKSISVTSQPIQPRSTAQQRPTPNSTYLLNSGSDVVTIPDVDF